MSQARRVAFQGEPGAYANLAAREALPQAEAVPRPTFEDAIQAVRDGETDLAIIPIENSLHGRIADIHHLLPEAGLYIVGEHFHRVRHQLLGVKGARLADIKTVFSQGPALGQCRNVIRELKLKAQIWHDTAGSARHIAELQDKSVAAIASSLAGEFYGLDVLKADVEDATHNMTRFLIMAREPDDAPHNGDPVVTTFIFRVRNVPAALYKAMGGFATNSVNMTKLESYQLGGSFNATQFYADIEGHPEDRLVRLALEELQFFTTKLTILGVYPAHPFRKDMPGI
ncbi:MAG: prephenate dehydratase [Alphaproteobacteria bacterium]|nr:prephenate dehydratase [Alphaproteobacteria bacterium]MBU6471128.1 prephenate dehydratase [Alphaproteobacteria bacterium]MDE2013286.1 prephenate dehydratase [Alphaproteobacteria bacterium]